MKFGFLLLALAGLLLASLLIGYQGYSLVSQALLSIGWGLFAITAFHFVPMTLAALAWRAVGKMVWCKPVWIFVWARVLREAVSNVLPVGQLGAELAGARVLTFHGANAGTAGASVVVDLTMEIVSQFIFTLLGLALLVYQGGQNQAVSWLAAGLGVAALALPAFIIAQQRGLFRLLERLLHKLADRWGWQSLGRVDTLNDTIQTLYRDPRGLLAGCGLHLLSWLAGAGEIWLALYFMSQMLSWSEVLLLESLGQAIRSAAFVVPAALGVQEGGFMLLAGLFGLSPETGLVLSLSKRVRDLLLGLPALLAWQVIEGRRLLSVRKVRKV